MDRTQVRWGFTRNTILFLFVLAAMFYAGASQQNAAAYLLLFTLAAIGIISIPHALSNVRGLTARADSIKPAFAGQEATVPIEVANQSRGHRRGIRIHLAGSPDNYEDLEPIRIGKAVRSTVRFPVTTRGEHAITAVCLETTYPLGLTRIRRHLPVAQRYTVYPKPQGDPKLPASGSAANDRPQRETSEGDDFAGVRAYVPGESQRHIDWKAVARGQGLMTKLFTAESDTGLLYLDYSKVRSPHIEERLSQLALWVIEAERAHRPYGLRLPNLEVPPSLGERHYHRCLRTLALY
jgi:uncharacterized protein (DUF58 family)